MDRERERERERERLGERSGYDQGWKSTDRDREQQREVRDRDREPGFQGGSYASGGRDRSQQEYQPFFQSGGGQQQQQQQQQQYGAESRQDFTRYSPYDTLRGGLGDQQKWRQWQPEQRYAPSGSGFGFGQESRYPLLGGGIQYQQYPSPLGGSAGGFAGNLPGGYPENVSFGPSSWLPSRSFYSGGGFRETPYFGAGAGAGAAGSGTGAKDWSYGSRLGFGEQEQLGSYGSQGLSSGLGYGAYDSSRGYQQQQQQQQPYKYCHFSGKESCDINLADVTGVFYPNVDIYEDRNNMYLDFELPGIKREDIYLHIAGAEDHRVLNVSGVVRDKPFASLDARYLQKNRKTGRFKLKIHLPDNIRTEEITADLTDGILTATIPKTEDVSSGIQTGVRKRIDITSRLPQYKTTGAGGTQEKFGEAERTQVQGTTPQQAQITPQPPQLGQTAQQQQMYRPGYSAQT